MNNTNLLVDNYFIAVPKSNSNANFGNNLTQEEKEKHISYIGTLMSNFAYYGYVPSINVYEALNQLSVKELTSFWKDVEPILKSVTAADKKMDKFVVYKNFPKEVLEMSEAQYWVKQIFIYFGVPTELVTEDKKHRTPLKEQHNLKVLSLADDLTLNNIFSSLVQNSARWSDKQQTYAKELLFKNNIKYLDMDLFSFKENGVFLINEALKAKIEGLSINISNATDVLRLASAMSEGDVSLREKTKFKKFKRSERKFLLEKLNNSNNLVEDFGLRKEVFKRLLAGLHPGDYNFENVNKAYDALYKGDIKTVNSDIESKIEAKDSTVLSVIKSRPGDFVRRFHKLYELFGQETVKAFEEVLPQLKTIQLLKLDNYLMTINERNQLIYPPRGNWTKAQFVANQKEKIAAQDLSILHGKISTEIGMRLEKHFPEGVDLDMNIDKVKLQTNDQKLATYGRGTEFDIPDNMNYIRTASYWENKGYGTNWFDNGWNFFDQNWQPVGTCCWNHTHEMGDAAVFSGDPVNGNELKGRACQMIDLYLDKLESKGVRYAVWNILAYSHIKFSDATEVLATLQWGDKAQQGKLYEPSRAQMVFPVTGDNLTKYVAYVDVVERKLVYMDANLYGNVQSAGSNANYLAEKMPAFVEYLKSLPSVADLFIHAKEGITPIYYSDKDKNIAKEIKAYVFKPENANNDFTRIELSELLEENSLSLDSKNSSKKKMKP